MCALGLAGDARPVVAHAQAYEFAGPSLGMFAHDFRAQLDVVGLQENGRFVRQSIEERALFRGGDRPVLGARTGPAGGAREGSLQEWHHGVARVEAQVHQHLAHLVGVGLHEPQIIRLDRLQGDARVDRSGEQPDDLGDNLIGTKRFGVEDGAAGKAEKLGGEVGRPPRRPLAGLDQRAKTVVRRQARLQQRQVAEDDGEQVVEVVGHAAGQLADRLHLLRLTQLLFQGVLLGNVPEDAEHADDAVQAVAHRRLDDAHAPHPAFLKVLLFQLQALAFDQHPAVVGAIFSARAGG